MFCVSCQGIEPATTRLDRRHIQDLQPVGLQAVARTDFEGPHEPFGSREGGMKALGKCAESALTRLDYGAPAFPNSSRSATALVYAAISASRTSSAGRSS